MKHPRHLGNTIDSSLNSKLRFEAREDAELVFCFPFPELLELEPMLGSPEANIPPLRLRGRCLFAHHGGQNTNQQQRTQHSLFTPNHLSDVLRAFLPRITATSSAFFTCDTKNSCPKSNFKDHTPGLRKRHPQHSKQLSAKIFPFSVNKSRCVNKRLRTKFRTHEIADSTARRLIATRSRFNENNENFGMSSTGSRRITLSTGTSEPCNNAHWPQERNVPNT